jgi:hypothetical protein
MRFLIALLLAAFLDVSAHSASAATAYKCVGPRGAISFQDHPCRSGDKQDAIALPDSGPSSTAPPPDAAVADAAAPDADPPVQPPAPPPIPPPAFYLCTRQDGSRYISDTGQRNSTAVPLGVRGVPDRSLADAYSGPDGIGVSAPGLRKIPHVPASKAPLAGAYEWVDDECHFAAPREACKYLQGELDDVSAKLRRAFSDTEAQLKQQQNALAQRMRGCS